MSNELKARVSNELSEDDVKAILEELEGIEVFGAGRRIFGWGLTGVVLGLGLAAVALVFETYFAEGDPEDESENGGPRPAGKAKTTGERAGAKTWAPGKAARARKADAELEAYLEGVEGPLRELAVALDAALLGLGDDAERAVLKRYVAYKRAGANFACAAVRRSADEILVYLRLEPLPDGELLPFMRDVTDVGHIGTGDLELRLAEMSELDAARDYLAQSYAAV